LFRLLFHPDPLLRAGMRWYSNIGRRVWCYEIWQWLFFDRRVRHGPTVGGFLKGAWRSNKTALPFSFIGTSDLQTKSLIPEGEVSFKIRNELEVVGRKGLL